VEGLSNGQVFIEGLANLDQVPDEGGVFQFLPVKIARSSGGPGRAVVWVPTQ
jgi:kynurenine formamidase